MAAPWSLHSGRRGPMAAAPADTPQPDPSGISGADLAELDVVRLDSGLDPHRMVTMPAAALATFADISAHRVPADHVRRSAAGSAAKRAAAVRRAVHGVASYGTRDRIRVP